MSEDPSATPASTASGKTDWETEVQAATGKRVLLVEGEHDQRVIEAALTTHSPLWTVQARVVPAGARAEVFGKKAKKYFPDAIGLVDRDVWTDTEAAEALKEHDRTAYLTPGWCLENTLIRPR